MKRKRISDTKPRVVWVRAICQREVSGWYECWFNNDKHMIYIENKRHVRRASRRTR